MAPHAAATIAPAESRTPARFDRIRTTLLSEPVWLCPERALLVTEYFRRHDDPHQSMAVRKARALRHVLCRKTVRIWPDELIVGNVGGYRKAAIIQPELAGVFMAEELMWIERRRTTPHPIEPGARRRLLTRVLPYWLGRNMLVRAFRRHPLRFARYVACATQRPRLSDQRSRRHRTLPAQLRAHDPRRHRGLPGGHAGQGRRAAPGRAHRLPGAGRLCPAAGGRGRPPGRGGHRPGPAARSWRPSPGSAPGYRRSRRAPFTKPCRPCG